MRNIFHKWKDFPPVRQKNDREIFKKKIQVSDFKDNKNIILLQTSGIKFALNRIEQGGIKLKI
jgi:hypothetical protein